MGNRANVFVRTNKDFRSQPLEGIYLYTHNGGYDLPLVLQRALAKRWRWHDSVYLTRIIFCEMVRGHEDRETGFGISTHPTDTEHTLLVVDADNALVFFTTFPFATAKGFESLSFEEYVAASEEKLRTLYNNSTDRGEPRTDLNDPRR